MKQKKWIVFPLIVISLVLLIAIIFKNKQTNDDYIAVKSTLEPKETLATEQFVIDHLLLNNNLIATDFKNNHNGNVFLSESIGLWLHYLALKEDEKQFKDAIEALIEHFLLPNHLISWRINGKTQLSTNALIDDLRIVSALFYFGERTGNEQYVQLAEQISKALVQLQVKRNMFVDFYDLEHEIANDTLTLSYIKLDALHYMVEHDLLKKRVYERMEKILRDAPQHNNFFPKTYDVIEKKYTYEREVHFIDQLYIALQREKNKMENDNFFTWMKEEFYDQGKLFGRYYAATQKPIVSYESASVYALAILYSLEKNEHEFATDLYERMITLRVHDTNSPYEHGYVDVVNETTHSFDNLLPLLAERVYLDEQAPK